MDFQTIDKKHWGAYFDQISKMAVGKWMQLEIVDPAIGDQIEEDWMLFEGVSYDRVEDVLHVHTDVLDHAIPHLENVVSQENGTLKSVSIKDEDGRIQIIHFRDPLLLGDFKNTRNH
jgi:hypothetical protein